MFVPVLRPGRAALRWLLPAAFAFAAASSLPAQTAPQLLPYTARLVAGGGSVSTFTVGQTCPSGAPNTATDKYGDGCLGSDIQLTGPRFAIADSSGNVFFSDYTNGLIRRVDAVTGVVTAVAGGASATPAKGASCGTGTTATATDAIGDGCQGPQVKLGKPTGLAFDSAGNLYFDDYGNYNVRELHAVGGAITSASTITLVDGNTGGANITSYGYEANNGSLTSCSAPGATCVVANTQGLLRAPYDLMVDPNNNVLIPDEYYYALLAVNQSSTTQTVATISIPAGTVGKIAGAQKSNAAVCSNGTASSSGCYGSTFSTGAANTQYLDNPFTAALSGVGNIYISNAYNDVIAQVNGTSGNMVAYAGIQGSIGKSLANTIRNTAGSFAMGAVLGSAADASDNLYLSDETNGLIWRVDGASTATSSGSGHLQYVVAGGGSGTFTAGGACSAGSSSLATDTFGDGCPAMLAKFGANGGNGSNSSLGVFGVKVDANSNLYVGDASNNLVREIATGAQFGVIGANQPTDILDIHFAAGDGQITPVTANGTTSYPSFKISSGSSNFTVGTPVCTKNNDNSPANTSNPLSSSTTDCLVPVTATPSTLGAFTGTLQVTSANGAIASFPLSGVYAQSPTTRTTLSYAVTAVSCSGTTTYSNATPVTITATVIANGPNPPTAGTDTVTFYANNGTTTTKLGSPVQVINTGSSSSPIYTATTTYTFATPGTYTLTAVFSGDSYFETSTGTAPQTITSSTPSYTITPISNQQGTVSQGQTALYSFTLNQAVYTGTINFAVTGLPANSSYTLSPQSITGSGCSSTSTVALSILTQQQQTVGAAGITGGGRGWWQLVALANALVFAGLATFSRRRVRRFSQVALAFAALVLCGSSMGCGKASGTVLQPATPKGSYTITVTASSGSGSATPITFALTVQ